ncbi:MAG: hypothetical protein ACRD1R_06420 [Acidobacteriota bacterium]
MATRNNYVKGQIIWCSYLKEMKGRLKESEYIKRARREAKGEEPIQEIRERAARDNIVEIAQRDRLKRSQAALNTREEQEERELVHQ